MAPYYIGGHKEIDNNYIEKLSIVPG